MLSLLLHHHQPDYRDPVTGEPVLPFVRLHAVRGYRDVAMAIAATGAAVTVNLVPSLVEQWAHYARGGTDSWERLARRAPEDLEPRERDWFLARVFSLNPRWFTFHPGFEALRGRFLRGDPFDSGALRDTQAWHVLAACGWSVAHDWPEVPHLQARGGGFTEAEKHRILDIPPLVCAELPALHRQVPELSASPRFHPILPLLIDTSHARRCMPLPDDPGFAHPEDARIQLEEGRAAISILAGRAVTGLWPSEGSVSREVVELAYAAGFRWLATDAGILARSHPPASDISAPYDVGSMRILFRDSALSDRIGFVYADWDGVTAADDLLHRARGSHLIALDGENPWEHYRDAGRAFLLRLLDRGRFRTCADMAEDHPAGRIDRLHTGSWVGADFRIWIGHPEDVAAWKLLAACRADWERLGRPIAAKDHLLAAEGSDWFWWYGDDFDTPLADVFDSLFRGHLAAAWRAMGITPPSAVGEAIKGGSTATPATPESVGGGWFAWQREGRIPLRGGAMAAGAAPQWMRFAPAPGGWQIHLDPPVPGWEIVGGNVRAGKGTFPTGEVAVFGPRGQRIPETGAFSLYSSSSGDPARELSRKLR